MVRLCHTWSKGFHFIFVLENVLFFASLQVLTLKTPFLLPSSFLILTGLDLWIRTSKINSDNELSYHFFSILFYFFLVSLGLDGCWWIRQINLQQKRFVSSLNDVQIWTLSLNGLCVVDGCRWTRPLLSLPSTQLATLTTSPSATSSHMETRRRNPNPNPNHHDTRVIIWSCRNRNEGWNNVEVLDLFVCSVGIKIVLFIFFMWLRAAGRIRNVI